MIHSRSTPSPLHLVLLCALCASAVNLAFGAEADPDTDNDGLSDFDEIYKHCTDPRKADSDDDGIPDGDPNERREFTYTVRTVLRIIPPISEDALSNDYQDGKVIAREAGDRWVDLEIVHYPLNTVADAIEADRDWRSRNYAQDSQLSPALLPGVTANWTPGMREDMLAAMRADRVRVDLMPDDDVVKHTALWLLQRVDTLNSSAYAIQFQGGKPRLVPGTEDGFRSIMIVPPERGGEIEDQFERELYGRGMYEHRSTGSCTSAATYLTTGLRAMGIPTRMIRAVPLVDASDPAQIELVRAAVTQPFVRDAILGALDKLGRSFAGHTYNEVYVGGVGGVGGRWRTLNYDTLGQNTLDGDLMGLLTIIQRYNDFAECGVGDTWGVWLTQNAEQRGEDFQHSNPYRALEVQEQFGVHSGMTPPPENKPRDHTHLTIERVCFANSEQAPDFIRQAGLSPGTFLAHVREWFPEQDSDQLKRFTQRADLDFLLKAPGRGTVPARAAQGCAANQSGEIREIIIEIPDLHFRAMTPGIAYTLEPKNAMALGVERWIVRAGVTVTKPAP